LKGKATYILGIIILSLITLIGVLYLLGISGVIFWLGGNPPKPQITYGEFPCKLVYEVNGEIKIIEDTIICNFEGFENQGSNGKVRKWTSQLKSGNKQLTIVDLRNENEIDYLGRKILELSYYYGNGEYYMGDELNYHQSKPNELSKSISYLYQQNDSAIGTSAMLINEVYERYKVKLISFDTSPPIKNSFK
jgi:hypothetical protein